MDVTFLVPMFVCIHVLLQPASHAEALLPPKLSVYPQHPEYFDGERVELTCFASSAPKKESVEGFRLFDPSGGQIFEIPANPYQRGKFSLKVHMESTGNYTCDYWITREGREVTSARSKAISLQIKEAPAAPLLSLSPSLYGYTWGDIVSLVCAAPPNTKEMEEFQYYHDREGISTVSTSSIYIYNLSIMETTDVGLYKCAYIHLLSGRPVISQQSNPVSIDIRDSGWGRMLAIAASFFTINGLMFLISHCFC